MYLLFNLLHEYEQTFRMRPPLARYAEQRNQQDTSANELKMDEPSCGMLYHPPVAFARSNEFPGQSCLACSSNGQRSQISPLFIHVWTRKA
jgi:hypothetical protein